MHAIVFSLGCFMARRQRLPLVAIALVLSCMPQSHGQEIAAQENEVPISDAAHGSKGDRPNIIYIMSDDMGFSDIGCYGSEIETPHLNQLAHAGLRFTQFYNTARCCPTRASLLTGLYPHQAGIGHMMSDSGFDGYRGELNRNCVTIAEVLRTAGYRTYMSGKWHVTKHVSPREPHEKHNWPLQRGFDRFYGTIHGAGSFFDPNSLTRDNELISPFDDPEYQPAEGFYYTDAIADHAQRYIREHAQQASHQPFFMYVSFTAAHWPMHARHRDVEKYRGKYDAGYDATRAARYARMIELGLVSERNSQLRKIPDRWKEEKHFSWDARNMEVYAAMIDSMDQGIGRILATLRATEQWENTLVLFFQDNGGCAEGYGRNGSGPSKADSPSLPPLDDAYLQPDMQPKQTRDGYPVRTGTGVMAGPEDTYIAYGKGWATVSNTPFREYKHWVHEGGISSPLIAHWPAGLRRAGEIEDTPGHLIDLMATAVDLAGAEYPQTFHDNQSITPMEGLSLQPLFNQEAVLEREALYWEHEGNRAVRVKDMKLVAKGADADWELYDIANDRSEQYDLAATQPQLVEELAAKWTAWASRAHVFPLTPYRKQADNPKLNRSQLTFRPHKGDDLARETAPFVKGRGFLLTAEVDGVADGVIVAQGGSTDGWSLFFQDQKLCFAICRDGVRATVESASLPKSKGLVSAHLTKDGELQLSWNDAVLISSNLPGPIANHPLDGLQVGYDDKGCVGNYEGPFPFPGDISNVEIRILK